VFKARQTLGKYRISGLIGSGGFAAVYRARDTVEGIPVALKIPHAHLVDKDTLGFFRREARLTAGLDHPNILPIKTASFIDGHFVIVYPLGKCSLSERLTRRIAVRTALDFAEQMLQALAYAHDRRIIHCDVKPGNLILFEDNRLRLADFGIAKLALHSLRAHGTGTFGFVAPEQAMGRPSFRSDVFAVGLVVYRMLTGVLPEWPFDWPLPGHQRLKRKVHPDLIAFLRRALALDSHQRFRNARHMLQHFHRGKKKTLADVAKRSARRRATGRSRANDWQTVQVRQFLRLCRGKLETRHHCRRCQKPVAEAMRFCPWCRDERRVHRAENASRFPALCPRCRRGVKLDWRFCPWCYGGRIGPLSEREYSDSRYEARCTSPGCRRDVLMPFMRYCPSCNTKVTRRWRIPGLTATCGRCGWGVVREFWKACPWCGSRIQPARS
jgi:serine/threonine-protein kinase